ncbi:MAG TPA: type II secretion system F family protein [Hypericibacter adhaerens]|jgi:tight adherence protein B|uniref:Secretion protein F n=1 Tax=Hypericibacter adhaerens TaxID=2602016 RepID=A0A5J6MYT3_9PROT|nr:type II secretion system F family protein [Hypericibacter adhaerens]QEX22471.1 secretion protein F [Hypericibacter adhaerens]HWA41731.1 type II secretion system F family protein [Hypericibacter adhaerens]
MTGPIQLSQLLMAAGVLGVLSLGLVIVALFSGAKDRRQRQRRLKRAQGVTAKMQEQEALSVRRDASEPLPFFDRLARAVLPNPTKIRQRLARSGKNISLGQYALACLVVGVLSGGGIKLGLGWPGLACLLIGVTLGLLLPHVYVGFLGRRRLNQFNAYFSEAIDLIVRGLRSGLPVTESIKAVGREIADPVGVEFRLIADSITFGMTLQEALWAAAARIDIPEYRFFAITLGIQQETGGNLAETLDNLSQVLRRRRQMKLKIKALSSEAKASAYIIGSLPFIMFGIIMAENHKYAITLFVDPRGWVMLAFGFACYGLGIGIMWKMVKFEI